MEKSIVEKYLKGQSINSLSKEYNKSWDTIKRILQRNEVYQAGVSRNQYGITKDIDRDLFSEIKDEESAYWLGILYADGSIREDRNEIALDMKDKDIIEKFKSFIGKDNQVRECKRKYKEDYYISYAFSFSDKKIRSNLIELGCVPNKTKKSDCPKATQIEDQFFFDFLRGIVDGDGFFEYNPPKRKYRIVICGNETFIKGLSIRLSEFHGRIFQQKNTNAWYYEISRKKEVEDILELMYENASVSLDRKKLYYETIKNFWV